VADADARGALLPCRLVRTARDEHRWAGPLALAGLGAGAVMAVVGLPPLDLHGPLHYLGVMGPLCGGTRAVHAIALGHLAEAWRFNPFGFLLVAGAVVALVREAVGRMTGRWWNLRLTRPRLAIAAALVLIGALTVNQQLHAELLRSGPEHGPPAGLLLYAVAVPLAAAGLLIRCGGGRLGRRSG
jgi:hypothetical protein